MINTCSGRCKIDVSLCFWNINGVSNKFLPLEVANFNVRTKCPDGFYLIGRSEPVKSLKPRGGVAFYMRIGTNIDLRVKNVMLPDCLLIEVLHCNVIFVCMYIPPTNSEFYKDEYFDNLQFIIDLFNKSHCLVIMGDLNSRVANLFPARGFHFKDNPDNKVNSNGQQLIKVVQHHENVSLINGLIHHDKVFDSKLTFYRGKNASQNDLCMSNNIEVIRSFDILPEQNYSDHCPCVLNLNLEIKVPTQLINECAVGFKSYEHLDINKKLRKPLQLKRINLIDLDRDLNWC